VESIRVVVGALGARPKLVGGLDAVVAGRAADENLFANIASVAHQQCRPLTNVPYDADWRHEMVKVEVTRALRDAFAERTS
jgi:4-hydroxybenzoyl-CoA reductase subunit beta